MFALEPIEPDHLLRADQLGLRLLCQAQEPVAVPIADSRDLRRVDEAVLPVLTQCLQESETLLTALQLNLHQRLGDELRQQVEDLELVDSRASAHCLGCLQRPASCEHGQPTEHDSLGLGEQIVAPVEQGPQGLMARHCRPTPCGEQAEAIVQVVGNLLGRQRRDPRRRQLDRQRNPVQPPTDLDHQHCVLRAQREARPNCVGAFDEQADRLASCQYAEWLGVVVGQGERGDPPDNLGPDPQRLTTGHQDPQVRACLEQWLNDVGARLDQVLAIVEHEESLGRPQRHDQGGQQRLARSLVHPQDRGDRVRHELPIHQCAQLDQPHSVDKRRLQPAATSRARLVLPIPPGPVRVTSRFASTSSWTSAISCSRPMKLVRRTGSDERVRVTARQPAERLALPYPDSVQPPVGARSPDAAIAGGHAPDQRCRACSTRTAPPTPLVRARPQRGTVVAARRTVLLQLWSPWGCFQHKSR